MLKNDLAHGLTVSLPNRDKLTMRAKLGQLDLIFVIVAPAPEQENIRRVTARYLHSNA
jgi:hypothetical protein